MWVSGSSHRTSAHSPVSSWCALGIDPTGSVGQATRIDAGVVNAGAVIRTVVVMLTLTNNNCNEGRGDEFLMSDI